ncbi:MAG: hypothetical protein RMI91_10880 [Gemmatales bacterium]|nr:thioredoxin family protein [Gemmatales bacterium]MDW7995146.1 hypothetical protein [Gemmatales bacterium]
MSEADLRSQTATKPADKPGRKPAKPRKNKPNTGEPSFTWLNDYTQARLVAQQTGKPIFVVFR